MSYGRYTAKKIIICYYRHVTLQIELDLPHYLDF